MVSKLMMVMMSDVVVVKIISWEVLSFATEKKEESGENNNNDGCEIDSERKVKNDPPC